ncbi:MAG: NAD(P)-binding domain-containing protein [Pseudomonadota bacterium]
MTRRAAVLGLGRRGEVWARLCLDAGWRVRAFDPAPNAASAVVRLTGIERNETISAAVRGADWVICSVPDRLELIQMVVQRAQAEAPDGALIGVVSPQFDVQAIQSCALHAGQVVRLLTSATGGIAFDVTERNTSAVRQRAEQLAAELAACSSVRGTQEAPSIGPDAESA